MNEQKLKAFLKKNDIKYNNIHYYKKAFTHSSFSHESQNDDKSYERLEFLGDSILGKIVAEHLFLKYPNYDQGDMTLVKHHLVNKNFLAVVGKKLGFEKVMFLGEGEDRNSLSVSIFEDVFESLVAAIYLDSGSKAANDFVHKHICSKSAKVSVVDIKDPKTRLQELLQSVKRKSVTYKIVKEEKIDNVNYFNAIVMFDGNKLGAGRGLSKKEAEKEAAKNAYKKVAK